MILLRVSKRNFFRSFLVLQNGIFWLVYKTFSNLQEKLISLWPCWWKSDSNRPTPWEIQTIREHSKSLTHFTSIFGWEVNFNVNLFFIMYNYPLPAGHTLVWQGKVHYCLCLTGLGEGLNLARDNGTRAKLHITIWRKHEFILHVISTVMSFQNKDNTNSCKLINVTSAWK